MLIYDAAAVLFSVLPLFALLAIYLVSFFRKNKSEMEINHYRDLLNFQWNLLLIGFVARVFFFGQAQVISLLMILIGTLLIYAHNIFYGFKGEIKLYPGFRFLKLSVFATIR